VGPKKVDQLAGPQRAQYDRRREVLGHTAVQAVPKVISAALQAHYTDRIVPRSLLSL